MFYAAAHAGVRVRTAPDISGNFNFIVFNFAQKFRNAVRVASAWR